MIFWFSSCVKLLDTILRLLDPYLNTEVLSLKIIPEQNTFQNMSKGVQPCHVQVLSDMHQLYPYLMT